MANTRYTIWGITWFILCLIGMAVCYIGYYLDDILSRGYGTYAGYTEVLIGVFFFLGFGLLLATIIIDAVNWYIRKKTREA